jgi:hypothetical protein
MEGFKSLSPGKIQQSGLKNVPGCEIEALETFPSFPVRFKKKAGVFDRASQKPDHIDGIIKKIS